MGSNSSLARGNRGLRWKLTLSYTAVTVGALIAVEIILLVAVSVLVFVLVNSGARLKHELDLCGSGMARPRPGAASRLRSRCNSY